MSDSHRRWRHSRPIDRLSSDGTRRERHRSRGKSQVESLDERFASSNLRPCRLASGATWQSSGQVSHLQNTSIESQFVKYSRQLYEHLHEQGHDIGFAQRGSLWVAQTSDRFHILKRQFATTKASGIPCEILDVDQLKTKVPIIDPHNILGKNRTMNVFLDFRLQREVCGFRMT